MALSPTEESLVRQLIAQNPALLNLASSESTIISKLGATKVSLSDLSAATSLSDADLALVRQGLNDKSFAMSVLLDYVEANIPTGIPGATFAQIDALTSDQGPIICTDQGGTLYAWDPGTSKYVAQVSDLQWLGTPIGGYITPLSPPPKDDPRFRYVLCTAGETGSGDYNEGILTNETVTGSAPLIEATATVDLDGSPFDGLTIHLINTEGRFVGAGAAEAFEDDAIQNITGTYASFWTVSSGSDGTGALYRITNNSNSLVGGGATNNTQSIGFDASRVARTSDHTQPRAHRLPHYRRIL